MLTYSRWIVSNRHPTGSNRLFREQIVADQAANEEYCFFDSIGLFDMHTCQKVNF